MKLDLSKKIVEFLSQNQGQKFTAREIAEWVFRTYPEECAASPDIEARIAQAAKEHFSAGGALQKKKLSYTRPMVGTRLIREYRGVEYQVAVLEEGYEYQGCAYSSLSKIARHITGAAWSGPAFFGLTKAKGGRS